MKSILINIVFLVAGLTAGAILFTASEDTNNAKVSCAASDEAAFVPVVYEPEKSANKKAVVNAAELKRLQALNERLSAQIEQMNLPVSSKTTYPELMKKIDKLPDGLIEQQLAHLIDEDSLKQVANNRALSKRLVEVALTDTEVPEGDVSASVAFSRSPVYGNQMLGNQFEINRYDTVFAHILSSDAVGNVFVKWQYNPTGEILLFRNYILDPNGVHQYVSLHPADGWQTGGYTVSIHRMDDAVTPLAVSSYSISNVIAGDAQPGSANNEIIQQLIMSGQAVGKQH